MFFDFEHIHTHIFNEYSSHFTEYTPTTTEKNQQNYSKSRPAHHYDQTGSVCKIFFHCKSSEAAAF